MAEDEKARILQSRNATVHPEPPIWAHDFADPPRIESAEDPTNVRGEGTSVIVYVRRQRKAPAGWLAGRRTPMSLCVRWHSRHTHSCGVAFRAWAVGVGLVIVLLLAGTTPKQRPRFDDFLPSTFHLSTRSR